ncbi:MAG: autotransporter domain-containing protein [Proteobacteria bacterium]|nr:autotransporter domain-containing protein [Pseudomonadota bacterium]
MLLIHRLFASRSIRTLSLALFMLLAMSAFSPARAGAGLSLNNVEHTVEAGQTISSEGTDETIIGVSVSASTLTNEGAITATNKDTVLDPTDPFDQFKWASGVQGTTSTIINSGTISASSIAKNSKGIYLIVGSVTNTGAISASSISGGVTGVDITTTNPSVQPVSLSNSGTISASSISGDAYGVFASGTVTNTGTISASSSSGSAYGIKIGGNTLYNYGTICATSTSGTARAIHTLSGGTVYLGSATKILSGDVYSDNSGTASNLYVTAATDMDFNLTQGFAFPGVAGWAIVEKSGSGTWTLNSGTNAIVTDLIVNNGTMNLSSGGTLNVADAVVSGGVLYLSSGASLTVTNALAVSGGTLVVQAQGQATAPLDVSGASSVSGGIAVDVAAAGLNTSSAIVSSASAMALTSYNPNFTVQSSYSGGTSYATASFSPQDDGASLGAVASLASAQAFAGVSQARSLSLLAGGSNVQESVDSKTIMVAANGSLEGLLAPREQQPVWGVYLQPVHNSSTRDGSDSGGEGYESNMVGLEAGIDRQFGNWVLGVMVGGGAADIDFTGSDFVKNDTEDQTFYTMGLYAGYRYGDWSFANTLSLTCADHEYVRNAGLGQTAKADYESWLTANQLLAVYNWHPAEFWTVAPRAGLNLISLHREGFGESGAANAVSYDDLDKIFAEASLGLRIERKFSCQGALISPYVGAGFVHSLGDTDITVDQHLDAASTSAQVTTATDSSRVSSELGVTLARNDASLTLGYAGEYGEDTKSHSLFGTLRMKF